MKWRSQWQTVTCSVTETQFLISNLLSFPPALQSVCQCVWHRVCTSWLHVSTLAPSWLRLLCVSHQGTPWLSPTWRAWWWAPLWRTRLTASPLRRQRGASPPSTCAHLATPRGIERSHTTGIKLTNSCTQTRENYMKYPKPRWQVEPPQLPRTPRWSVLQFTDQEVKEKDWIARWREKKKKSFVHSIILHLRVRPPAT